MHTLSSAAQKQTFRALSFGKTTEDYIQFTPADMSPFQSSFTGCAWIKRQHETRESIVLHFLSNNEIIMGSNGYWNSVNKKNLNRRFPEKNVWFHYCMSSSVKKLQKVYINGRKVGITRSSLKSKSGMEEEICLGNRVQTPKNSNSTFGGQLFYLS